MATTVDLVWFNAGGGHRAAADALEQAIHAQGWGWQVRKVHLTAVLDPSAQFRRTMGFDPEDLYNLRLSTGFTLGLAQELRLLQALIRASHGSLVRRLARHWQCTRPDMVVSLIPNFNRALHDSLQQARPAAPFVTVMTDMADHPPAFWAEPGTRQHLVCGTAHAADQALAAGVAAARVHRVRGMLLRPDFHRLPNVDRAAERLAAGLDARTPTGLVMFGGAGSSVMQRIAQRLPQRPLILLCGRHAGLADAMRSMPAAAPRVVLNHTPDVVRWMRLADYFIGKPGPGSLSEAVHVGLPVVVTRNSFTMPQERWNTEWVQQHGLGVVHRSFRTVAAAVEQLLQRLPEHRANALGMHNRAVFDVPLVLQRVLHGTLPARAEPQAQAQAAVSFA
jgi:UDP-N-acetylglucosamine:LPS N-acetylglucosamine transferase